MPDLPGLPRAITGFHRDEEGHWVAELECGHGQHVRHDPPWQVREWVTTEAGRRRHLGTILHCVRCARGERVPGNSGDRQAPRVDGA